MIDRENPYYVGLSTYRYSPPPLPRYNIAPTQTVLAIVQRGPESEAESLRVVQSEVPRLELSHNESRITSVRRRQSAHHIWRSSFHNCDDH